MSILMDDEIKRWTARRKNALVLEVIQGKTSVAEASRSFDLPASDIERWVDEGKRGMANSLRAHPLDLREQYEEAAEGPAGGLRRSHAGAARKKKLQSLLGEDAE